MKKIREIIQEEIVKFLNESIENNKTINDEFEVSDAGLSKIKKILEKVNKNLKTRNKTQLEIQILKTEERIFKKINIYTNHSIDIPYNVYTIKIIGDIPEIHDYEFIAKIEHTIAGNIINMNPSIPKENLPAEYRSFDQRCDICGTKRERNNTFILKKVETGELMVVGSTCLKKFLSLDDVKAMLNLGIQLETLRTIITSVELTDKNDEEEIFGPQGEDSGGKFVYYYYHKDLLYFIWLAYLENNKFFISKSKSELTGQNATIYDAEYLQDVTYGNIRVNSGESKRVEQINKKYGSEAKKLTDKMMNWMKKFDWDQAMLDNPNFSDYYHNLKVIINLPAMEYKHIGYFSSMIPFYLRTTQPKTTMNKNLKKESDYVGVVGDKILNHEVKFVRSNSFNGAFGIGYIIVFEDNNSNSLIWFTSSDKALNDIRNYIQTDKEKKFKINGKIKQHRINDFQGKQEKQTILKNVKVIIN